MTDKLLFRVVAMFFGIFIAAYKMVYVGVKFFAVRGYTWDGKMSHWFGIMDPDPNLQEAWDKTKANPWRLMHWPVDVLVEWNRLNSQRAVKFWCALLVTSWVVGWVF